MPPHGLRRDGLQVLYRGFLAWWQGLPRTAGYFIHGFLPKLRGVGAWWRQPQGRFIFFKGVLVITSILLTLGVWRYFTAPNAWAVILAGERIGIVASQEEAGKALEKVKEALESAGYQGVELASQVEYVPVRVGRERINTETELEEILAQKVAFRVLATEIRINDMPIALVKDNETAQKVLEELKKAYTPGEGQVEEIKFKEHVTLVQRLAFPEEVLPFKQAVAKLLGGAETREYTVQEGDSLWSIAQKYGLTVEQLRSDNPQVQGERLDIGQVLKVRTASPLVHVVAIYRQEVVENIPYGTETRSNPELWRGEERVKQEGEEGQKKVTYRLVAENGQVIQKETISSEVIKEPVPRVVERGTRVRVALASRGGGSGRLAWPIYGYITSGFGYRGREFHTGIDIGASYGSPVGAAEAGRVIYVGYDGGYGRTVLIDHGGGLVTRYSHLSGYNVEVGQEVSRGEVIGYVGASGRATGPHLHFEVIINGEPRNPLNYLR
ncbi:Murein DD-endopeptidase MepM and murein hydrolase activator NlpD, contain LysM domain [Thermanaeromonas toyohensis ToBE]|uniref:Murein DD-endopeptidase MepM and murein hydrolase activator NlpD, contain LysM domain n=1 Tax=Thermanaeromonas toyohensis ToBE TaxID=698762 RepID=A0A1W1V6E0_9FIRM|nr:M23 family metallopeptidase [Thermanaeromonas toyohensis]SMB88999.1 Murein DD-endopeptidase MepM and murein hydrolase activator NlpD, contain LysM domain [Thermanaeromonas toyohensis ToBE]